MDGLVAFGSEEGGHTDGACTGDTGEIVAHQIHDHDVFGSLFLARQQRCDGGVVFGGGASTAGRSFHGPHCQVGVFELKEEFGAGADDGVTAEV